MREPLEYYLVMNVMIIRIVSCDHLERIVGQSITAMVVNRFECRKAEQQHGLACAHSSQRLSNGGTQRIEDEAFDGMVIKRTKSIWNVESVVDGVKLFVQELVPMH